MSILRSCLSIIKFYIKISNTMIKRLTLFTLLSIVFSFKLFAYTEKNLLLNQADRDKVKESLILNQKWVPYPSYSDRNGWDKLLKQHKQGVIEKGEQYLDYAWQVVKMTDYLEFEKSGNRTIMEKPFNSNNSAIVNLLMAELAEGKGRFIPQLANGVFNSCEMTSWVLSAHLAPYQKNKRSIPDYNEQVIDLGSGNLSSLLAWTYYFLNAEFDKIDPIISQRLHSELKKRTMDAYMEQDHFWWMAFNYKPGQMVNNWNPWCNFNVLQCFMLLENDKDKLADAVYRTMTSVDQFINYSHIDGACEEGPSYWGHAAGKMYDYLQLLADATDNEATIFNVPQIKAMGEYISRSYVDNQWVVNFADASAKGGWDAQLIYRYGKAVDSDEMKQFAAYVNQDNEKFKVSNDIFRTLQSLLSEEELQAVKLDYKTPNYTWYPETEFCYMKNAQFFVAAKGGYNNESHNHNDTGTFSLYFNNTPFFIDAGVGTYTRQTFSSERYNIWTMQSDYHNLPMINGQSQRYGSPHKASNVKFNPKTQTFSLDIAKAYGEEAKVKNWERTYILKNNGLEIKDNFKLTSADSENISNFLVWGTPDISKNGVVAVEVDGVKLYLRYDANQFTPSVKAIHLDDPRLSNVWGETIHRVSLTAKNKINTGTYKFTITDK